MKHGNILSIGIPAYNQGEYLDECVQSLLAQTVIPLEIVVSNNHSTDSTAHVLEKYKQHVRIISPPRHMPMIAHWNFVVSQLRSDWFSLLSSDDVALPDFTKTLLEGIGLAPDAVLVGGAYEMVDAAGKTLGVKILKRLKRVARPPQNLYLELVSPKTSFAAFAARKSAWLDVGGFPEKCGLCADWGLWISLASKGSFVHLPRVISRYRYQYRQDVDKARLPEMLRGDAVIHTDVIPSAAAGIKGVNPRRIRRASRRRLIGTLYHLSRTLRPDERKDLVPIVEEWAKQCGCTDELRRFAAGKNVSRYSVASEILKSIKTAFGF